MIYTWKDKTTGKVVEVQRSAKEYEAEPTWTESGMTEDEYNKARWTKVVTGGSFSQGFVAVGKGSKGHW